VATVADLAFCVTQTNRCRATLGLGALAQHGPSEELRGCRGFVRPSEWHPAWLYLGGVVSLRWLVAHGPEPGGRASVSLV
jgi:hypothetical protein